MYFRLPIPAAMTDIDLEPSASSEGTNSAQVSSGKTVRTQEQLKALLERRYPKLEKEGIGEVVTLLPGGQLINLWRTLHHNLHVACVQEIVAGTGSYSNPPTVLVKYFVTIVILTSSDNYRYETATEVPFRTNRVLL